MLPRSRLRLLAPRSRWLNLPALFRAPTALVHAPLALVCTPPAFVRTPQPSIVPYLHSYSRTRALPLPQLMLLQLRLCSCISHCCRRCLAYTRPLPQSLMQQLLLPPSLPPCVRTPSYTADAATAAVAALGMRLPLPSLLLRFPLPSSPLRFPLPSSLLRFPLPPSPWFVCDRPVLASLLCGTLSVKAQLVL
ncbi:hypothetical protein PILCRDRAFT_821417 [Piloderma croceum F 1598]|uniref:Uncharacterized protein n=1 Tax=Piloderma croceum (strain F 1598) TaxID=765440 RepID=A0A0C3FPM0_PILCF|nr:hypothetical protein PILCRDRAFT_821417 [Piloderma croceum F 1598]